MCDHCEQSEQKPFKYQKLMGIVHNRIFEWSVWTNEQNLLNVKSSWEQFLTKFLCDQCEQREQNPFKYQKLSGTVPN